MELLDQMRQGRVPQALTPQSVLLDITAQPHQHGRFQELLKSSLGHRQLAAGSPCTMFGERIVLSRILEIENVERWQAFLQCRKRIRLNSAKNMVALEDQALLFTSSLQTFAAEHGISATQLNEVMLFHGASVAESIAVEGFDYRLAKQGFYGKGTYFSTQACKAHQYAVSSPRTIMISRVTLGNPHFATAVDKTMVRPPNVPGSTKRHDSVIVKPGPMRGHPHGEQTHTEFVIFESAQAYPEYILEYA